MQDGPGHAVKAKIRVPRLNGGRMGVLATRSPHRPVPLGLSVAQVRGPASAAATAAVPAPLLGTTRMPI